jgi:OOP family OmpA-OmpF porin
MILIKKTAVMAVLACAALGVSATSVAATAMSGKNDSGFVVGVQGGYGDTHWSDLAQNSADRNDTSDTGFAGRGFVGFDFNKYFAIESGFTYLPKTTFDGVASSDESIKNYAVDLLAKLSIPVSPVFSLYAKAGGSYLNSKLEMSGFGSSTETHIGPAFGVGAAYEVVPNLAIDLSWMRFSGGNKFKDIDTTGFSDGYQPSPDVVLLGVSYKFPVAIA